MLTSTTTGVFTPVAGTLKKVMDLGACQGTWYGKLAGGHTDSFWIFVDSTGTITGGSGFALPNGGKLFCESGRATGLVTTGEIWPMDQFSYHSGTVVSGATVTISGKYETNSGQGTYTLVRSTPPAVYSNATLTGTWMIIDLTVGPDTVSSSLKSDGNGSIVEDYGIDWSAGPPTLPYLYTVQANGLFSILSGSPTETTTGMLTSATTGVFTSYDSNLVIGDLKKVMDLGACQGTWSGQLAGGHTDSFQIIVDNTGTITGGSGFAGPIGGKLFCESGRTTGLVTTGESPPLDEFTFSGTVVSGATVTISGEYNMISDNGTYTLVK
jgi:uncharacterized protein affecting Mg2+/Co2+ transport